MIKISEIKGEKAMDILADIVDPIANIAADKEAANLFGRKDLPDGMTVKEYVVQRIRTAIPALIRSHKQDLIKILSALSDKTEDEYKKNMTLESVVMDVLSLMTDALFNAFFTVSQSTEEQSGSVSENTEE